MTDERTFTTTNGYNLSAGRSDDVADLAPMPLDGDDYTWDGWDDDSLTPDEYTLLLEEKLYDAERTIANLRGYTLLLEEKLYDAERTIANLRGELQTQRDGALVLAALVGITAGGLGVIVGALIW